jgi:hypothetical protein
LIAGWFPRHGALEGIIIIITIITIIIIIKIIITK